MKISKMFHWLYAFLMFLPVFFVLGKGLYVTFNQNAKDSYYGETINDSEIDNISSNHLVVGKTYSFINDLMPLLSYTQSSRYYIYNFSNFNMVSTSYTGTISPDINCFRMNYYLSGSNYVPFIGFGVDNANYSSIRLSDYYFNFTFTFLSQNQYSIDYTDIALNKNFYEVLYNKFSYLDNAIDYGMYELNESVLFAWAKDSFLSVPITYISSLFNMPSNSAIITALSYWLNISIIWLTFDVIMYVPLLAHRWLDKGVRE